MSDNLKVAKECWLFPDGEIPAHPVEKFVDYQDLKESLEEYTSRIIASQQAAHEAEIAKWRLAAGKWQELQQEYQLSLDLANAACAMKDEALKKAQAVLRSLTFKDTTITTTLEAICNAVSTTQVSELERKQLAEAEQRGAVKALEDFGEPFKFSHPWIYNECKKKAEERRATSKKAGTTIHDQIAAAKAEVATWPDTVKRATDINGLT